MTTQEFDSILEVGIDYITATAASSKGRENLRSFGHYLVENQVERGAKLRSSRTGGYSTTSAGSVACGVRLDGVCLRASAEVSAEHWSQIVDNAENVSRIDVQVTTRSKLEPSAVMQRVWNKNAGYTSGVGRRSEVKKLVGPSGIEIIRVASRQSSRYLRIYDKFNETGDERYRSAVRWELELKGELAWSYADQLSRVEHPANSMYATVASFCEKRLQVSPSAGRLRWSAADEIICISEPECAGDCIKTLRYLHESVRPCIERLSRAGFRKQVLEALGLVE